MKAGTLDKARGSFDKFEAQWDSIEESRQDSFTRGLRHHRAADRPRSGALKQPMPDVDRVTSLVSGIMDEYNKIVTQVTREARGR